MKITPCYNMVETPKGPCCGAGLHFPRDCNLACHGSYLPEAGEGEPGHDWQRAKLWREYVIEGAGPHE